MARSAESSPQREYAALALDYAVTALSVAERENCDDDEIVGLCDEVVKRRLRLQMAEMANGSSPTPELRARMSRDRLLLSPAGDSFDDRFN